ncbi:hypothetical protein CcaverHIS002_0301090 [Cutaneotrichosporon cavernicola]|uniref:Major facilitator superfamily (MFS) profile domain-containing protein n=1 Tax=Cutaneotrichosporon cavernicola TaxID=279322 RepID=A0AA48L1Q6_9TREE|nr:uncharacterized protein CcaverHIS019_0301050 [Cutaneotrichosporon cavernicola]BEI82241.1 hypothetical protein CcaverHIS002_0301090 [Cutaneotrichosporon cavernicola]BEI90035.1 hypothetical protein CcaverHIS019_0301050 [Cutaneotrichosporon cavernicola]BEI97809.1 hypothetical protein CcaverHIS631_0301080 [Cutaneotrichosporon cavernicola]BEJ05587.1 hypothetical protein CcaverHIS641_0301090 [Cutaneotrichosporon cavernicola]
MSSPSQNSKEEIRHVEHTNEKYSPDEGQHVEARNDAGEVDIDAGYDPADVKRVMRKIDFRLIPILTMMYLVSAMDRANLSLAQAANKNQMVKDLELHIGNRYSIATMIFFIPYIILEVPSQAGLRVFGAKIWLGGATVLWGVMMLCMGFVKNWQQLTALRALLGVFEATLFPGAAYLISCWYPRRFMATRMSYFFIAAMFLQAFSGILAWGIGETLHTKSGLHGWQWIFIIYGLMTIFIGFCAIVLIVDFPDKATFLTEVEREIVLTRIQRDRNDAVYDHITFKKVMHYLTDFRIWLFGLFFCAAALCIYALAYFLPQILAGMGFDNKMSQILTAPPSFYSPIPCIIMAKLADKKKWRMQVVAFNALLTIIGVCMFSQLSKDQTAARYVGVFLAAGGCQASIPLITAWSQTCIRSQSKRAVMSAVVVAWGGIGGILAGVSFRQAEKPHYTTGIFLTVGLSAFAVVGSIALWVYFMAENRKADRGEKILEGDPDFRYQ